MKTDFSIIIPTYLEAKNLPLLIKRIANINFEGRNFEVIVVDDNSPDNTNIIANELTPRFSWLTFIVRKEKKDLSQAILAGSQIATFPVVVVMDADLSHPPEKIPTMLQLIETTNTDMVIGSRYVEGGSIDTKWPMLRILSSKLSSLLAKFILKLSVQDPLSGFIATRRVYFENKQLNPIGWKIGLELMVKNKLKNVKEVPISFTQRKLGKSKLSLATAINYFRHLWSLLWFTLTSSNNYVK